jgi:hypothetical protein
MLATGFALLCLGVIISEFLPPHRWVWDWRDLFTTLPTGVGLLLMIAGIAAWLWEVAP